jgi:hypothetical protein
MDRTLTTKAGFQAFAGAARPSAACLTSGNGQTAHHQSSWTMGAVYVKPNTFEVIALTDRPSRRHSELSP